MESTTNDTPDRRSEQPLSIGSYLLDALRSRAVAPERLPSTIDLDVFGKEAEKLVELSRSSGVGIEYASFAYVDHKRKIQLLGPIRGDEEEVHLPSLSKHKRRAILIHTHGEVDTPFSPEDLEGLFIHPTDERAVPAVLLATPTLKMLILRSNDTPNIPVREIENIVERIHLHDALMQEEALYRSRYQGAGGKEPTLVALTAEDKRALAGLSHRRMFVLTRVAQEYNLRIYSCPLERNIAYSVS